jgi:hypothetical protein
MSEPEHWARIPEFPTYLISDLGNIFNLYADHMMRTSFNNHGHVKITLTDHITGERYDRSVRKLVAEVHVPKPNNLCDEAMLLDGDLTNLRADNIVWRPRWFVWKYSRQLKEIQPPHYFNLKVKNIVRGFMYTSIIDAGKIEGLLFDDIWKSTYDGSQVYPFGDVFEIM